MKTMEKIIQFFDTVEVENIIPSFEGKVFILSKIEAAKVAYACTNTDFCLKHIKNNMFSIKRKTKGHQKAKIIDEWHCDDFVYDLNTSTHNFAAGIGKILVHNTDSVFVEHKGLSFFDGVKQANEICDFINEYFSSNTEDNYIKLEIEKMFKKIFFSDSKKKYYGIAVEDLNHPDKVSQNFTGGIFTANNAFVTKKFSSKMIEMVFDDVNPDIIRRESQKIVDKAILQEDNDVSDDYLDISNYCLSMKLKKNMKDYSSVSNASIASIVNAYLIYEGLESHENGELIDYIQVDYKDGKKLEERVENVLKHFNIEMPKQIGRFQHDSPKILNDPLLKDKYGLYLNYFNYFIENVKNETYVILDEYFQDKGEPISFSQWMTNIISSNIDQIF